MWRGNAPHSNNCHCLTTAATTSNIQAQRPPQAMALQIPDRTSAHAHLPDTLRRFAVRQHRRPQHQRRNGAQCRGTVIAPFNNGVGIHGGEAVVAAAVRAHGLPLPIVAGQDRMDFREHLQGIPGELHERPKKNFANNRNEALAKGRGGMNGCARKVAPRDDKWRCGNHVYLHRSGGRDARICDFIGHIQRIRFGAHLFVPAAERHGDRNKRNLL